MLNIAYFIVTYVRFCNLFWAVDDLKEREAYNLWGAPRVCTEKHICIEVITLRIALHLVFLPDNDFEARFLYTV